MHHSYNRVTWSVKLLRSCFLLTSIACIFQASYRFSHVKWLCYFLRSCSSYGVDSVMYAIMNNGRS
jgi:hypothetical protein